MPELLFQIAIIITKIVVLTFIVVLPLVPLSVYFERRFSAVIQDRVGPNRVGIPLTLLGFKKDFHFFGLIQPIADGSPARGHQAKATSTNEAMAT